MKKDNIFYLRAVRVVSCIAVVFLHTYFSAVSFADGTYQKAAVLSVRNFCEFSVPLFMMVTGALLLPPQKEITYKKIFGRYILRIALTLLIFSLIFQITDDALSGTLSLFTITDGLRDAALGTGWKHMWYLYLIIAVYIMLPFYRKISASSGRRDMIYLLSVYFVFLCVIPAIETAADIELPFYICVFTVYPLYLFAGYAIEKEIIKLNTAASLIIFIISSAAGILLTIYGVLKESTSLLSLASNYSFPSVCLQSLSFFALARNISLKKSKKIFFPVKKIICEADKCTFGIYLIHMIFLKVLFSSLDINPFEHGGMILLAAAAAAVFILSFGVVWLLKKIPLLKKIV